MPRPTIFSDELADRICTELAGGRSLRSICEDESMPDKSQVFRWLADRLARTPSHGHFSRLWETSRRAARISIAPSRCTILRSTVYWRRALATTSARPRSLGEPWRCGCSVIPRPRSPTSSTRSRTPERSAMPRRRCSPCRTPRRH